MKSLVSTLATSLIAGGFLSGCPENCENDLGCGPAIRVDFEPPVSIAQQTVTIEVTYDDQTLRCEAKPAGGDCPPGMTEWGTSLRPGESATGGFFLDVKTRPPSLKVRLLRNDELIAEATLQPSYNSVSHR